MNPNEYQTKPFGPRRRGCYPTHPAVTNRHRSTPSEPFSIYNHAFVYITPLLTL